MLSSPIILEDHPQLAPESTINLFDGLENDEILTLRTLTLTDEEKAEARATDPRAAGIIDAVDAMPPEILERLHGAIRSLRPASLPAPGAIFDVASPVYGADSPAELPPTSVPWWDPARTPRWTPRPTPCSSTGSRSRRAAASCCGPGEAATRRTASSTA